MTPFPRCEFTDESYCSGCGEPDQSPSVECFEVFGETLCPDCAAQLFEDADKTHILTAMEGN